MTTISEDKDKKMNEFLDLKNMDKVRRVGSLSGWQRTLYNLITVRLSSSILDRMMDYVNKSIPEDADPEDVKNTLQIALMDYIDSVL
jgi:hypothetical protein